MLPVSDHPVAHEPDGIAAIPSMAIILPYVLWMVKVVPAIPGLESAIRLGAERAEPHQIRTRNGVMETQ